VPSIYATGDRVRRFVDGLPRHIDGEDKYPQDQTTNRMEEFIAPPSTRSLSEIRLDETTWEWPSNRLQLFQQPRGEYNFVAIKIIRRHDKGF
jgi:hypothetical protein